MKTLTNKQQKEAASARKEADRSHYELQRLRDIFARNVRDEVCRTIEGRDERFEIVVTEAKRLGLWKYLQRSHVRYAILKWWFRQDGLKGSWNFVRWRDKNHWEAYTWTTEANTRNVG